MGKIGVFDSGFGGLTILKEFVNLLPDYSFIYLSDNGRAPYGNRDQETIFNFTLQGVKKLFELGADLVILACNTSSSSALRRIQQEFLPNNFPNKKVLGIIIPTAEEIGKITKKREVGILATQATINSETYIKEIKKYAPDVLVYQQACPLFVSLIEAGKYEGEEIKLAAQEYIQNLLLKSNKIDTIILGCTHYAIIENELRKLIPQNITIVSQNKIVAEKLKDYLARHPEIDNNLAKNKILEFFTTSQLEQVKDLFKIFYSDKAEVKFITIE